MNEKQTLNGIDQIADFLDLQHSTLIEFKNHFEFPMTRDGGIWHADREGIKAWFSARNCTPKNVTTGKLERFEILKRQVAGKGSKFKRTLTGLAEIADFLGINDTAKINEWLLFYDGCPIYRNKNSQPSCDADALLQWLARAELAGTPL